MLVEKSFACPRATITTERAEKRTGDIQHTAYIHKNSDPLQSRMHGNRRATAS
jgi:hypothetical protein